MSSHAEQRKLYTYKEMRTYVLNPINHRHQFIRMPALLRILWDAYWSAMDMSYSIKARIATAATKELFQINVESSPTINTIMENLALYKVLKTLQPKIALATQLHQADLGKVHVLLNEGMQFYSGEWLAEKQERRRLLREQEERTEQT